VGDFVCCLKCGWRRPPRPRLGSLLQAGTVWNTLDQASEHPLAGRQLTPIVHGNHFRITVGACQPDAIIIHQGAD